jgi:hypothetical protein
MSVHWGGLNRSHLTSVFDPKPSFDAGLVTPMRDFPGAFAPGQTFMKGSTRVAALMAATK